MFLCQFLRHRSYRRFKFRDSAWVKDWGTVHLESLHELLCVCWAELYLQFACWKKRVKFSKLFLTLFRPSLDEVSWPFWSHLGLNGREDFDIALAFTWHSKEFFKFCYVFFLSQYAYKHCKFAIKWDRGTRRSSEKAARMKELGKNGLREKP